MTDDFTADFLYNLSMDLETREVNLVPVWDSRRAMHAVCVDSHTSEAMLFNCVELYARRL